MTYFSPGSAPQPGGRKERPSQPVEADSAEPAGESEDNSDNHTESRPATSGDPRRVGGPPVRALDGHPSPATSASDPIGARTTPPRGPADAPVARPPAARPPAAAVPRPVTSAALRPDEPTGDLSGLFPSRKPAVSGPNEPPVIDLTRHEPLAPRSTGYDSGSGTGPGSLTSPGTSPGADPVSYPVANSGSNRGSNSGSGDEPALEADRPVPPGFPVELPQPSVRREHLLVAAVSWLIVLFTTLLGALGGLTYASVKSATYTATSSVVITSDKIASGQAGAPDFASGYALVALDDSILQPALANAGISMSAASARSHLKVSVPSGTALMTIEARAGSPADAAALANAAADGIASNGVQTAPKTGFTASKFTEATAPTGADQRNRAASVLVGALIGLAIGVGIVVFLRRSRRMPVGSDS